MSCRLYATVRLLVTAALKESLAEAHAAAADAREVESLRVSLATEKQEKTAAKLEAEQMRARVRRKPLSLCWGLCLSFSLTLSWSLSFFITSLARLPGWARKLILRCCAAQVGRRDEAIKQMQQVMKERDDRWRSRLLPLLAGSGSG